MFAITSIKGIGRRLANVACKKAEVDLAERALFGGAWRAAALR